MDGIFQIITLLLGLSGFGIAPNPKPPTPEASLAYAIPDPDVVAHVDVASFVPNNYKLLASLADQPQIKAAPEVAAMVRKAVDEIEGARGLAKTTTGIDLVTDISDATAFVQIVSAKQPNMLVAVHGKLAPTVLDSIARMTGKSVAKVESASVVDMDDATVALTKDGVMLFGTSALVRERLAAGWHTPAHGAGTTLGRVGELLAQHPVFAVAVALSQSSRDEAGKNLDRGVALDLLRRHRLAAFAVFHDGIGWTWIDSTKDGLSQMAQMSDGFVQLLRASHIAPRAIAKMALAALESYRGDPRIDGLLARKADLMKIVDAYLGDGTFRSKIDTDNTAFRLNVRLVGRSVSDVLPLGMLLPLGAAGFYFTRSGGAESTPAVQVAVPPAPPPPPPPSGAWPRRH